MLLREGVGERAGEGRLELKGPSSSLLLGMGEARRQMGEARRQMGEKGRYEREIL